MLITVSGPPGSGKSTAATGLAAELAFDHVSGGDLFREMAKERDLSLAEFGELAEADDTIDRNLDRRLRETAADRDDLVLESRLAGWMAGEYADLGIWLDAPIDVRSRRIADREGWTVEEAKERTLEREANERTRYQKYYDIDFTDQSIYDMSLNTARWDADVVLDLLVTSVARYVPDRDEGKMPITGVRYAFE